MPISYSRVIAYLDAIADKGVNDTANAPHDRFWTGMTRDQFVTGTVPNVSCHGASIPILDQTNPANSPFFLVLKDQASFCNKPRMPKGGPFITDPGYTVTLANGTHVTGQQIQDDILEWLQNGFPEKGSNPHGADILNVPAAPVIRTVKIFPPIGIARIGKSPNGYFIGPEQPLPPTVPAGGFRDSAGLIKRQAARFRLFGFDEKGALIGEITLDEAKRIEWTVTLANTKAAADRFFGKNQGNLGKRNAEVPNRDQLKLMPPPLSVSGRNINFGDLGTSRVTGLAKEFAVSQQFLGKSIQLSLGTATTDDMGRLLVLGGYGESKSPTGATLDPDGPNSFANHDGWYDDVSDGLVSAQVTLQDGSQPRVVSAWVVVAPPKYAPGIQHIVTLYDTLLQAAVDRNLMPSPLADSAFRPSLATDIMPLLMRAAQVRWLYSARKSQFRPEGFHHTFNTMPPAVAADVFEKLSVPSNTAGAPGTGGDMPKMWSDNYPDGSNGTLTRIQYAMMGMWKDGATVAGSPPSLGDPITPEGLTRAALEPCVGAAFFPGIEVSWKTRDIFAFVEPFRLDPSKVQPGDLTSQMSLPWQSDFLDCGVERGNGPVDLVWWPAQRPINVLKPGSNTYIPWARVSDANPIEMSVDQMIDGWNDLAFLVEGANNRFEEMPRT
jgi:hypothetical protein